MLTAVIVPLDGSAFAERALPYGIRLSQAAAVPLVLVRAAVVFGPVTNASGARIMAERLDVLTQEAEAYLAQQAQALAAAGLPMEVRVHAGIPASLILDVAAERPGSLLVMTTHGRTGPGRMLFGSVTTELLHQTPGALLLVPERAARNWPADQSPAILVPLDGSLHGESVLGPAADLADTLKTDLVLVRVSDAREEGEARQYLAKVASSLRPRTVRTAVLSGRPADAIVHSIDDQRVGIVAMATHGRTGLSRLIMGSVAEDVVRSAAVPILVLRPVPKGQTSEDSTQSP